MRLKVSDVLITVMLFAVAALEAHQGRAWLAAGLGCMAGLSLAIDVAKVLDL